MGKVVRVPADCRWLLRAARWMAPRARRAAWRRRWEDHAHACWALLAERGEAKAQAHAKVLRHCRAALAEALAQRFRQASSEQ